MYAVGSAFESCPAATGVGCPRCSSFPDRAHRCRQEREHMCAGVGHLCTCGFAWISATINDGMMPVAPV